MRELPRLDRLALATLARTHPALAPQLEGDQVPELLHVEPVVARPALVEVRHRARDHVGIEDAGRADATGIEVTGRQVRELAPQPGRQRDAEALLRALQ